MKKNVLSIIFFSLVLFLKAQLGVFEDEQNRFYIFDENHFIKAEHMPVKEYWVGKNYVAFVRNNGRFTMYYQGKEHEITLAKVEVQATDHYLVYFVDEQVWLFDGTEIKLIDPWIKSEQLNGNLRYFPSFALSDSILAFTNSFERLLIYQNGNTVEAALTDLNKMVAGENILAYLDINNMFKAYYKGKQFTLEDNPPNSFVPKTDIIAYVDDFGTFKVWYKGEIIELLDFKPVKYYTADQMVAYQDDFNNLSCFYDGKIYELLPYQAKKIVAKDNILLYIDNNNFTHVFYKGESTKIANYTPKKIVIEDDFVVFQDLDGYIKAFENGKIKNISKQIALNFEVYNKTVIYQTNEYTWNGYYMGNTAQYYP